MNMIKTISGIFMSIFAGILLFLIVGHKTGIVTSTFTQLLPVILVLSTLLFSGTFILFWSASYLTAMSLLFSITWIILTFLRRSDHWPTMLNQQIVFPLTISTFIITTLLFYWKVVWNELKVIVSLLESICYLLFLLLSIDDADNEYTKYIIGTLILLTIIGVCIIRYWNPPIAPKEAYVATSSISQIVYYYIFVIIHGCILYKILEYSYKTEFNIILTSLLYGGSAFILQLVNPGNFLMNKFGNATFFTSIIPLLFFIISYNKPTFSDLSLVYLRKMFLLFSSLLGLSVTLLYLVTTFFQSEKTSTSYLLFLIYAIVYICLLLLTYKKRLNLAELLIILKNYVGFNTVLVSEFAFILAFLYIRSLTEKYYVYNGNLIQNNPITLSKVTSIQIKQSFQYQYSISFWMYINSASISTEYIPILSYGDKPLVSYHGVSNIIRISMKSQDEKAVLMTDITQIPLQKWNFISLNYNNGTFDTFFNGALNKSVQVVPHNSYDQITIGHDKGIKGKIANVSIFPTSITEEQVLHLYNAFKNKNPPIV